MRKNSILRFTTRAALRRFHTRLAVTRQRANYLAEMEYIDRTGFGYYL